MELIQTERLSFRQWSESDFSTFSEYFSNKDNTEFLGGIKNKEEAWRLLASYLGHYTLRGYSYMALEERSTGEWIGAVGLWNSLPWPETELGYWLLPHYRKFGFAFEAAQATLQFAFQELKMKTLVSYIEDSNVASILLSQKLGAVKDGELNLLGFGPHGIYRYKNEQI